MPFIDQKLDGKCFKFCYVVQAFVKIRNRKCDISLSFLKEPFYLSVGIFSVVELNFRIQLPKSRDTFGCDETQDAVCREQIDDTAAPLPNM